MLSKIGRFSLFFLAGSILYPLIEVVFRGYSHFSMVILGGFGLLAIALVDEFASPLRRIWKALLAAILITQMELLCGLIVNCHLGMGVWDYSSLPLNLAGQICLLFSFFWFLLSFLVLSLMALQARLREHPKRLPSQSPSV